VLRTPSSRSTAYAYAVLVILPSTSWIAIKIGLAGAPPLIGAGLRFLIAGPCLIALRLGARESLRVPRSARAHVVAMALLMFAIPYGLIYTGETRITSGLAAVLFGATPLFVVLVADRAQAREALSPATLGGALIGLAGLAVVFAGAAHVSRHSKDVLAMAGVVVAALTSATAQVRGRRTAKLLPVGVLVAWGSLVAGVLLTLAGLAIDGPHLALNARTLGSALYLGITAAAGFWSMFWLLGRLGAVWVSLHALVVPLLALVWGALFYGEALTASLAAGGAIVSAGIALVVAGGRRQAARGLTTSPARSTVDTLTDQAVSQSVAEFP
jgi:drug/metabolite transporter (DMT)-like permease